MLRALALLIFIASARAAERPAKWAQPVTRIKNFSAVAPGIYRSAQPDMAGMRELQRCGVKTVVSLREAGNDGKLARGTKLQTAHVKMDASKIKDADIIKVLAILRRKQDGEFLFHCRFGSDRTGAVCAMYRMVEQHWCSCEAIRELKDGGFGHHPRLFPNIAKYLRTVDVDDIRHQVGAFEQEHRNEPLSDLACANVCQDGRNISK